MGYSGAAKKEIDDKCKHIDTLIKAAQQPAIDLTAIRDALIQADENLQRYRKAYGSDLYTMATDYKIKNGLALLKSAEGS